MSHSCDEHYDVYDETRIQRARKPHTCDACKEAILAGADYTRVFILFDGRKESLKRCARCQKIHEHLRELCQQRGDGEMWPDERLNCGEDYKENWSEEPPAHIAALAFWLPGDPLPCTEECYTAGQVELECRHYYGTKRYFEWSGATCLRYGYNVRTASGGTEVCS